MRWLVMVLTALGCAVWAAPAAADVSWLCRPGLGSNPCTGSLRTTDARTGAVSDPRLPTSPGVDCFYVYPTVSSQLGPNANRAADPEQRAAARLQAQRFSKVCKVYAPLYRQVTAPARALGADTANPAAYADVREAFLEYLRRDNRNRGFVLVGHSQGATMLRALLRQEVDPKPGVRRRLVGAFLPGANVLVPRGADVGGDFAHVPACRARGQSGCVAAWSTFDSTPPANSRFGRPQPGSDALGLPGGPEYEVLCTNPADLAGTARDRLLTLNPSALVFPGVVGLLYLQSYGGMPPRASTPWVRPADRYSARCVDDAGANVLRLTYLRGAKRLRPAPDASWGQHLLDLTLPLGTVVNAVTEMKRGYRTVRLSVRRRGARTVVRATSSPGTRVRITQRLDGRVTGRRTVTLRDGTGRVTLRSKRLRHYTYRSKRLN